MNGRPRYARVVGAHLNGRNVTPPLSAAAGGPANEFYCCRRGQHACACTRSLLGGLHQIGRCCVIV
jgi:hypothetical protein